MLSLLQGSQGGLLDPQTWAGPATWLSERQLHWHLGADCEAVVHLMQPLGGSLARILSPLPLPRTC